MASNRLPDSLDRLFALADRMVSALGHSETAIGLKQTTAAVLGPILEAARMAEAAYGAAQVRDKEAVAAQRIADRAGHDFIANARRRLSMFFGEAYATEWSAAGWPNGSTRVPDSQVERFSLVESLRLYLVENPAHESADLGVTAAIAGSVHEAISDTRAARREAKTNRLRAKQVRDQAVRHLRRRMSGLIQELATLLEPDDPRWLAFGLRRPGDPPSSPSPEPDPTGSDR